jgi:translation initiation factor IF-2
MASKKPKAKASPRPKPTRRPAPAAKKAAPPRPAAPVKDAARKAAGRPEPAPATAKGAGAPAPKPGTAPAPPAAGARGAAGAARPPGAPAVAGPGRPPLTKPTKKGGRKSPLAMRRGPDGQPFVPGDLLLPGGPLGFDEIQYLLRGCVAAEHPAGEAGVAESAKKMPPESDRGEIERFAEGMGDRFETGSIESLLPIRAAARRNFPGVVERAKHRRREIGAFLRGLDLGRTETSHMDSHGEASLQSLMEWAARLENLTEADEPEHADYAQFHRGLDQIDNTTEALIVDIEQTLRRLRDRVRA